MVTSPFGLSDSRFHSRATNPVTAEAHISLRHSVTLSPIPPDTNLTWPKHGPTWSQLGQLGRPPARGKVGQVALSRRKSPPRRPSCPPSDGFTPDTQPPISHN